MKNNWIEFLRTRGICIPDNTGNMPCDNGVFCDRCGDPYIIEDYERYLEGLAKELK